MNLCVYWYFVSTQSSVNMRRWGGGRGRRRGDSGGGGGLGHHFPTHKEVSKYLSHIYVLCKKYEVFVLLYCKSVQ
jgi:hypothetical protein